MEKKNEKSCLKIAIIGPESTGKTTLAEGLSAYYDLPVVWEFAREYLEESGGKYEEDDLLTIAKGQVELEKRIERNCNSLLICDTTLLSIKIWADFKYGRCHPWIDEQVERSVYHKYFLMDTDVPWAIDPLRENPDPGERKVLFEMHRDLLTNSKADYEVLSGGETQRLTAALTSIENMLKKIS